MTVVFGALAIWLVLGDAAASAQAAMPLDPASIPKYTEPWSFPR
jgi:hypothetical protein